MRNDTSTRLAAVALMSVILLGTIAVAVGYMLNVQAAYAVEVGIKQAQAQVQIPSLQIRVQDPGSGSGDKGGGGDRGDHGGSSGGDKGGQGSGSNDERNRQDGKDDNNNSGQGQFCYSVTVTNPLNGKTRTVDVCFDSRSDCEQAQQHDPDSAGGCESR